MLLVSVTAAVAADGDPVAIAIALVRGIAGVLAIVAQRLLADSIPDQVGTYGWWR